MTGCAGCGHSFDAHGDSAVWPPCEADGYLRPVPFAPYLVPDEKSVLMQRACYCKAFQEAQ